MQPLHLRFPCDRSSLLTGALLGLAALLVNGELQGQMPDPPEVESVEFRDHLVEVDHTVADARFHDALAILKSLDPRHREEVEFLWRLSRVKVDVALEHADDGPGEEQLFRTALQLAQKAVELDPEHPEAHLAVAMAAGQLGLFSGIQERVEHSRHVRDHVDRVVELDPEHDVAYHVRARWHHEVATLGFAARTVLRLVYGGIPDASLEEAVNDFRKAIEYEDRIIHRLQLARTLIEKDQVDEAFPHLERAVRMPHHAPRDPQYQEEARELLRELNGSARPGSS